MYPISLLLGHQDMIDTEIQMILQRSSSWAINCNTVLIKEAFGKATQCENHVQLVLRLIHDKLMLMLICKWRDVDCPEKMMISQCYPV